MKIKNLLKRNKIYLVIVLAVFLVMLLSILSDTNIFYIIQKYIFDYDYRNNFNLVNSINIYDFNLIEIIRKILKEYIWNFDYMIIWGTNIFQVIVPIFSTICAVKFYKNYSTINHFIYYKQKKFKNSIFFQNLFESIKMALALFIAFILFYCTCLIISNGALDSNITRTFLIDLLGIDFYFKYTYLYYLIDGFFKFLFIPIIYNFTMCSISLFLKNLKDVIFVPLISFYGLILISSSLSYRFNSNLIYLNPAIIYISGAYTSIKSIYIFIFPLLCLIISILLIIWRGKNVEI